MPLGVQDPDRIGTEMEPRVLGAENGREGRENEADALQRSRLQEGMNCGNRSRALAERAAAVSAKPPYRLALTQLRSYRTPFVWRFRVYGGFLVDEWAWE